LTLRLWIDYSVLISYVVCLGFIGTKSSQLFLSQKPNMNIIICFPSHLVLTKQDLSHDFWWYPSVSMVLRNVSSYTIVIKIKIQECRMFFVSVLFWKLLGDLFEMTMYLTHKGECYYATVYLVILWESKFHA